MNRPHQSLRQSQGALRGALHMSLAWVLAGWVGSTWAATAPCAEFFFDQQAPQITNQKMVPQTRVLCFTAFAVLHSGQTRTPLWSASHLTRASVNSARELIRINAFHTESALPVAERATLQDYARSGFDRGHMFPSGDAPTAHAQQETFSLANMVPQDPDNNRRLWQGIESAVRTLTRKDGELFVISGPVFAAANLQQLNGRVLVPTQLLKVVYSPRRATAAAYLVDNAPSTKYMVISVAQAEKLAGINFFPTMKTSVKDNAMALPTPRSFTRRSGA